MTRLPLSLTLIAPLLIACELKGVDLTGALDEMTTSGPVDPPGMTSDGPGTTGDPATTDPATTGEPEAPVTAVDILFVIDNSGSMAGHQSRLVAAIPSLLAGLDGLDLRIAVTTTDSGNPNCPASKYTPEAGKFVMRSCTEAVANDEFKFSDEDYATACTDVCAIAPEDFVIIPTATDLDPMPKPRSWLERTGVQLNVLGDLDEALACALPQGVNGCGFEQPLESMYKALAKADLSDDPTNAGFLRPEADLRIIFVTDEEDCSHNPNLQEIFTVNNKVFWEDPSSPAATSAICFNAGVTCTGGPGTYDSCTSANYDVTGALTSDPSQAVLHPPSKYVDFLQGIQASKVGGAKVRIFGLAGVPVGFETGAVPLVYADDPDINQQTMFGIGPSCTGSASSGTSMVATAYPPTRLLNFAEAFGPPQFFSICDESFEAALMAAGFAP